jgi:GntR family transcriptional regulator
VAADQDFTPRYYRIEQALRADRGIPPHDPLPSEFDLAREHGVSRMTARAAVTHLVSDGLAYRVPGRGTFVAVPASPRRADNLVRFGDEIRRQGKQPTSRAVSAQTRPATTEEAARLHCAPDPTSCVSSAYAWQTVNRLRSKTRSSPDR